MAGSFQLTEAEQRALPSEQDIAFYRSHGWFLTPPLLSPQEIADVVRASEGFYRGERDRVLPGRLPGNAYWQPGHGDVQRHNDYIAYESDAVRRILCKPLIGAMAARLMDTPAVRLWSSTLIYKPAQADEPSNIVPWHIDRHHWQTCTSDELITAFIPLHDCDEANGTLTVLDGSHAWRDIPPQPGDDPTCHFAERPAEALDTAVAAVASRNGASFRQVPLRYRAGQMSFHHCRTYHSSGPHLSGRARLVVTIRFQDHCNTWRPATTPVGEPVIYSHDMLVRRTTQGHPDYSDPEFCPLLWAQPKE
jgi:hypothetical protein